MCSTVQEQITTCGQNAIVKIGERTNIRPQKLEKVPCEACIPPAYSHTPRPKKLDVLDLEL